MSAFLFQLSDEDNERLKALAAELNMSKGGILRELIKRSDVLKTTRFRCNVCGHVEAWNTPNTNEAGREKRYGIK
jgi:predicted restriction endonuclease